MSTPILSIHAHPDDAETLAGGTLALLAQKGHSITIVTMTSGDCGSHEYRPDEIAAIRQEEAASAARLISASYRCAEFGDLAIFNDDRSRRRIVELLRELQPELVVTSSPVDYHCDHEATSLLVRDACFAAPAPNYDTRTSGQPAKPMRAIPHLYFMDPVGACDRDLNPIAPDFFVDVSSTFEKKKAMLACHSSQREWLRKHHGMDDYIATMERWTRACGTRGRLELAEGFRRYKNHPYPQTPLLEELLAGYIHNNLP